MIQVGGQDEEELKGTAGWARWRCRFSVCVSTFKVGGLKLEGWGFVSVPLPIWEPRVDDVIGGRRTRQAVDPGNRCTSCARDRDVSMYVNPYWIGTEYRCDLAFLGVVQVPSLLACSQGSLMLTLVCNLELFCSLG